MMKIKYSLWILCALIAIPHVYAQEASQDLNAEQQQLARRKAELDAREKALDRREKILAEKEKAVANSAPRNREEGKATVRREQAKAQSNEEQEKAAGAEKKLHEPFFKRLDEAFLDS